MFPAVAAWTSDLVRQQWRASWVKRTKRQQRRKHCTRRYRKGWANLHLTGTGVTSCYIGTGYYGDA
jgi:hypothetical protein